MLAVPGLAQAPAGRAEWDSAATRAPSAASVRASVTPSDSAGAEHAELLLSWNAPWGSPRAQRARVPACADSTRADTLYMSIRTGEPVQQLQGFTAKLVVHAVGSDTLGDWWRATSKGGANAGGVRVEWASQHEWEGALRPFRAPGQGFSVFESFPFTARVRMIFAVASPDAAPVAAEPLYALARVIFEHRPQGKIAGCDRPVVIEWSEATLAMGARGEPPVSRGERFVSFAGPYAITEPFRGAHAKAWQPARPR